MHESLLTQQILDEHPPYIQDPGDAAGDDDMYKAGPSPQGIYITVLVANLIILCWFVASAN